MSLSLPMMLIVSRQTTSKLGKGAGGYSKMTSSEEATVDPLNCDRTGSFLPPKVECLTPSGSITGFVTVGKFLHFINLNRFALFVFDFASQLISYYF